MNMTLVEEFQRSSVTSVIGLLMFFGSVWVLTWNEGRAVHHAFSLEEAYNNVISLNPFERIQPEYDGRLVHISGPLIVEEPLTEPNYDISIQSIKLKRRVQMYQWVEETSPRAEADITAENSIHDYYYVTEWRDKLVDSSNFYIRHGHQNPTSMPLKTVTYIAPFVRIGYLMLSQQIKEKFKEFAEVTSDNRPEDKNIKLHLGIYYHCEDVWNPKVGDIRVQFYYAGLQGDPTTIIAKQKNGVLVPYVTSKGHEIALIRHGLLTVNQMFSIEHADAKWETWKIRGMGVFLMYAAIVCLAKLLRILLHNAPLLRSLISYDVTASSNFAIALSISLFVISIAWIAYRPMLGFGLMAAAISPFLYCTLGLYSTVQAQNNFYNR